MHSTFSSNQLNLVLLSSEITRSHKTVSDTFNFFTTDLLLILAQCILVVWFGISCASLQLAQLPVLSFKGEAFFTSGGGKNQSCYFLPVEAVKNQSSYKRGVYSNFDLLLKPT